MTYEDLRDKVIKSYKILYKDSLAMDINEVPKKTRVRLLEDEVYITKTKAIKAHLFAEQLETIDAVIAGSFNNAEKPNDTSGIVLKALEMKQKLLLEDLGVTQDEGNALNVTYVAMTKEEFENSETVEVNIGSNNDVNLGADFGVSDDNNSFESRMKAETQEKLKELENGSNS